MREISLPFRIGFYLFLAILVVNIYNFLPLLNSSQIVIEDVKSSFPENNFKQNSDLVVTVPEKILIPKLGVQSKILPVGKDFTGSMQVPSLFETGWYRHGPKPGEVGNAVIDGHEVDEFGLGVVFKNLYLLDTGDSIFIQTKDKKTLEFIVTGLEVYKYNQAPLTKIFGPSDLRNLNLITCEGHFIPGLKTKNMRLVVFSTLTE